MKAFNELGLKNEIAKAIDEIGFTEVFPVQAQTIPYILAGKDVVCQSHTGSGKTAAFVLPMLQKLDPHVPLQALILAPTRELAMQVTGEIKKFAKYMPIRAVTIYGGQSISVQFAALKRNPNIIVATPGRLIDHVKRRSISLDNVNFVVLDEADKMFDMGFIDDIRFILDGIRGNRQTCLFSATIPDQVVYIAARYMNEPEKVMLNSDEITLDTIDQSYLLVDGGDKFSLLCDRLRKINSQAIVFCATKYRTDKVARALHQEGFRANAIHGDLSQSRRDMIMQRFRDAKDDILVATDLAARGIDVPAVGHIINFDVPADPLVYFHRIGRTARAGGSGTAFSLVSDLDRETFERILGMTELPIRQLNEEMGIPVNQHPHHAPRRRSNFGGSDRGQGRSGYGRRGYGRREYGQSGQGTVQRNYYGLRSRW